MPWKGTSFKPELFETKNPKRILKSSHQKKLVKTGMVNVLAWFLNNTYKFHFVSKVAGRMFLRINFFIDTNTCQYFNIVSTLWIVIQITLTPRWKWNKFPVSDFQRCTTLIQCQYPALKQNWINVAQRQYRFSTLRNVGSTLFQRQS